MKIIWQLIIQLAAVVGLTFLGNLLVTAAGSSSWLTLIVGLLVSAAAIFGYAWVVRRTEHRTVDEVGLDGARRALVLGVTAGITLFAIVITCITLSDGYRITGFGSVPGMLWILGFMAAGAVAEELIFRGVLFRHVEGWFGTWIALIGTGIVFGMLHLTNPDATLLARERSRQ